MSRSNPNLENNNPATRFFEWSGSEGKIKYYDKVNKENVFVGLPFTFLVLDQLNTITGYSDTDQSGFWSNEVRDLNVAPLTVKTKAGIKKVALYADLADILNQGAKYAKSIYIAFHDQDGHLEIGNFKASGSSIGAWIDYCKEHDPYDGAITIKSAAEATKGANTYFIPHIVHHNGLTKETENKAMELDIHLQKYLKNYLQKPHDFTRTHTGTDNEFNQEEPPMPEEPPTEPDLPDDDIPF